MKTPAPSPQKHKPGQAAPRSLASLYAAAPCGSCRLPKREHLCRTRLTDRLFEKPCPDLLTATRFPLRALCRPVPGALLAEGQSRVEVLFSVSKRSFKRAVRRNRAKRQMREAYRLLRRPLLEAAERSGLHYSLAFLWMGKEPVATAQVARAMGEVLSRLAEKLSGSHLPGAAPEAGAEAPAPAQPAPSGETPCTP